MPSRRHPDPPKCERARWPHAARKFVRPAVGRSRSLGAGGSRPASDPHRAPVLVNARGEQAGAEELGELPPVEAALLAQGIGLRHGLGRRGDQEIPGELDDVRGGRVLAKVVYALPSASRIGWAFAFAAAAPEVTIHAWPAAAASGRPKTGAATSPASCSRCAAASRRANAGEIALIEEEVHPTRAEPRGDAFRPQRDLLQRVVVG
jgi:hypothetical protein